MNKIFEDMDQKEQKAVKFAFELVAANDAQYHGIKLIKLKATGTTNYPVYYWYLVYQAQTYVLRVIKQGRKCKLMSFGNPKLIWSFVNEKLANAPKRENATVECFTKIFKKDINKASIAINWFNKYMEGNVTLADFGITNTFGISSSSSSSSKTTKKPVVSIDKKKAVFAKLIKKEIDKYKNYDNPIYKNYISFYLSDLYYDNDDICKKYWDDVEKFEEDAYRYDIYKISFPKYTTEYEIQRPSGWMRNERSTYVDKLIFKGKTVKEFDSLNKYIQTVLKCKPLKIDDVKREHVHGKRSSIFERQLSGCLAYDADRCKKYKAALQKIKKSNWKATIKFNQDIDRDEWSYRAECEWEGYYTNYAIITFTTPSGKKVNEYELWP